MSKYSDRTADVRGIVNHEITSVPLATPGGVALSTSGEVIVIMHQHAYHGKNKTIHSSTQIEHHKIKVDDSSIKVVVGQHSNTLDNCNLPMSIRNTLTYVYLRPPTDKEWEDLPHVILTSDMDQDPKGLDCEGQVDNQECFDAQSLFLDSPTDKYFNEIGDYRFRSNNNQLFFFDAETYDVDQIAQTFIGCNSVTTKSN